MLCDDNVLLSCPPVLVQVPGVMSALPVISGTLWCSVGAARPASATTTSTCTTRGHATLKRAPVSGACTTLRATRVSTANWVTTATLPLRAAVVSTAVNVTPPTYCMYMYIQVYFKLERDNFPLLVAPSVPRWYSCWRRCHQDNQIAFCFLQSSNNQQHIQDECKFIHSLADDGMKADRNGATLTGSDPAFILVQDLETELQSGGEVSRESKHRWCQYSIGQALHIKISSSLKVASYNSLHNLDFNEVYSMLTVMTAIFKSNR